MMGCALVGLFLSESFIISRPGECLGVRRAWQAPAELRATLRSHLPFPTCRRQRASPLVLACARAGWQGLDVLSVDDLTFDRYIGSVSYTESVSVEESGPELTAEGAMRTVIKTATVGTDQPGRSQRKAGGQRLREGDRQSLQLPCGKTRQLFKSFVRPADRSRVTEFLTNWLANLGAPP